MPDDSFKPLLDRDMAIESASGLIGIARPALREIINYSTNAVPRCIKEVPSSKDDTDVYVAPFVLFRHSIEVTDAIEVGLSRSCVAPMTPLLRSSFETALSLKYIFETDERRRSLAWLCGDTHQRLRWRKVVQTRNVSPAFSAMIEDEFVRNVVEPEIQRLQAALDKPHMRKVVSAYQNQTRSYPHWYSLFGGPINLRALAEHLGWRDYYDLCYRLWSSDVHATGGVNRTFKLTEGRQTIDPIRYPGKLLEVASYAGSFLLDALATMTNRFRPTEEASREAWYKSEVRPAMERIRKTPVKINAQVRSGW